MNEDAYDAEREKKLIFVVIRILRKLLKLFVRKRIVVVLTLFSVSAIVNGTLFYLAEVVNGPQKDITYLHCIYWAIVTMATVGYGDIVPHTFPGYVIASETIVIGIAVFTLLVSTIAEAFLQQSLKRYMGLAKLKRADVIVIGSSEICREAIDELKANRKDLKITWVLEQQPRTPPEDVDFIVGDPVEEETLIRAGIKNAKNLIICLLDDSISIHVALTARRLNKNIKIVAVAKSSKAKDLLEEAGVSIVVPLKIIGRELASAVFEPSVTMFVDEVTTVRGIADLIEVPIDSRFKGLTANDVAMKLEESDKEYRYVPLMLIRNDGVRIAAPEDSRLESGDKLVLLKAKRNTKP